MERLLEFIKERKRVLFLCVVVLIYLVYLFFSKILQFKPFNLLSIIFVLLMSGIVYISVSMYLEYLSSKRKLSWVNSIYDDFVHMQIFLDNNDVVIEVLEGEAEKLEQLAKAREFKSQRVFNKNDLVKILIK